MIQKNAVQKIRLMSNRYIIYYFTLPALTLCWEIKIFLNGRYEFWHYYFIYICSYLSFVSIFNALFHQQSKLIIIESCKDFEKALDDYIKEKEKEKENDK